MDDFEALAEAIRHVFPASRFEPVTESQVDAIRHEHPNVPRHYLDFLQRIGWGSMGDGDFMVYSGLCKPEDFFDLATTVDLHGVLLIGDDFGGWMVGFDTKSEWRMVGVDSAAKEPYPLGLNSLAALISQRVADNQGP